MNRRIHKTNRVSYGVAATKALRQARPVTVTTLGSKTDH